MGLHTDFGMNDFRLTEDEKLLEMVKKALKKIREEELEDDRRNSLGGHFLNP